MAADDTLYTFDPACNRPPASAHATLDTRNDRIVLDFDDSTNESAIFAGILPANYAGGGLTLDLHIAMTSATSGNVLMEAAIERINAAGQDLDSDGFAAAQASSATAVPGTTGLIAIVTITFTDGAQMDSLAAGEAFRIKVTRDATDASDTAAGDLELLAGELSETSA